MDNHEEKENIHEENFDKKHDVTRRQFLNYTLMGVGGFMAAGMLLPMTRFAIDPLLQEDQEGDFVEVMPVADITTTPTSKKFEVETVDGWYRFKQTKTAYIFRVGDSDEDILALSTVCTHLGCDVGWSNSPSHPDQFYCPCHGGLYTKEGINVQGTPPTAPLHAYDKKIKNGKLYLGKAHPRTAPPAEG